jgi:hypothetical protein
VRDFAELAENYQFTPVRMGAGNLSGYLHLHSNETKAVLSSKEFHHFDDDENGWFDLEIEDHRGSRILLHNALTNSQSMGGVSGGKRTGSYTSDIFPNIVILGSENLRKDRRVQSLSFTIEGGENFFVYDVLEWRSFHAHPTGIKCLRRSGAEHGSPRRAWPSAATRTIPTIFTSSTGQEPILMFRWQTQE